MRAGYSSRKRGNPRAMLTKEIISGFNLLSLAGFVVMELTLALNRTGRGW